MKFGILQGRLSKATNNIVQCFPVDTWQDEFKIANELGLIRIEWLFDNYSKFNNPIFSIEGRKRIHELKSKYFIEIDSLCADYFRDNPLKNLKEITRTNLFADYLKLLEACEIVGIKTLMVPYVDYSKIITDQELEEVIEVLEELAKISSDYSINISLETNLNPIKYEYLIKKVNSRFLKINYDSGDSASLGYNVEEEFKRLSSFFIQIHIKDRIKNGGSVPLGNGDCNFKKLFTLFNEYKLNIPLNLQTASELDPIYNTKKNIEFLRKYSFE